MSLARAMLIGPMNRVHSVYRYSSRPVHKQESVAEHSYFVALYALMINDHLGGQANTGKLLTRAIMHDVDECVTGDFVRSFKYSNPVLREHLGKASQQFMIELVGQYPIHSKRFMRAYINAKDESLEGKIIRVADYVSVVAYLIRELQMGNATMLDVVEECHHYGREVIEQVNHPELAELVDQVLNELNVEGLRCEDYITF